MTELAGRIADRHLDWDGCCNVRDLGGLRTADGRTTRRGAVVRADAATQLTAAGWVAAWEYGVRTVVDLRNDDELGADAGPRPAGISTVHHPLDGLEDTEFWDEWGDGRHGTPLYYAPFLARFPQRVAGAVKAVAHARPGGVLVHCGAGRDRTGLVALMLLALAGVPAAEIVADHALSAGRLSSPLAASPYADQAAAIERILAGAGTTAAEVLHAVLAGLDVEGYLRSGGLDGADLAAVRERLLGPDVD